MTDKNDFKMPFLKTTEYAAEKIYDGLINKNVFEIHFPKSLGVGGSLCLLSLVRLESFIVSLEHFLIACLNFSESCKPPEVFEGCVDPTLRFTQLPNFSSNLSIGERHLSLS